MKTKKMLFKAAVCLMVVMFVFSSVSALAADYYTTTTYNLTTRLATVKTVVIGASGEVAYLAYNGDNPETEGAIFHIDQTTGTGNDVFEYTVDPAKIDVSNTHSILVGTQGEGRLDATETEGVKKLGTDYTLTVNFTGCKVVLKDTSNPNVDTNTVTLPKSGTVTVGNGNKLVWAVEEVDSTLDANTAKATLGGTVLEGNELPALTGDATLTITMDAAKRDTTIVVETSSDINAADRVTVEGAVNENTGATVEVQRLTRLGTISLGDYDVEEYGIIINELDENNAVVDTAEILGGGFDLLKNNTNGKFAIIVEGVNGELNGTYSVQTFVKVNGVRQYGATYIYKNGVATIEDLSE